VANAPVAEMVDGVASISPSICGVAPPISWLPLTVKVAARAKPAKTTQHIKNKPMSILLL